MGEKALPVPPEVHVVDQPRIAMRRRSARSKEKGLRQSAESNDLRRPIDSMLIASATAGRSACRHFADIPAAAIRTRRRQCQSEFQWLALDRGDRKSTRLNSS